MNNNPIIRLLRGAGCGSVTLTYPEFDVVALADRQTIQADLTDQTKQVWRELIARFPGQIELIGGVGDAAHAKRRSCHNVLRDDRGRTIEKAKALDIQPVGVVGSPAFIALGNEIAEWLWLNRVRLDIRVQIWRRRIRSVARGGVWRRYLGINGHMKHIHVSIGCNG